MMSKTPSAEHTDDKELSQLLKLLLVNNSELGRYIRYTLTGLCASIESIESTNGSFDKCEQEEIVLFRKLSKLLNKLIEENTPDSDRPSDKNEVSIIKSENPNNSDDYRLFIQDFCDEFFSHKRLSYYISDFQPQSTTDSDLWEEIQRILLRVPESIAEEWRDKAIKSAIKIGAKKKDEKKTKKLPFLENKLLYPGLTGKINAEGIYLSTQCSLNPDIKENNLESELKYLAQIVSIFIDFIETDPSLHHCLKSINFAGIISFDSTQRKNYIRTLKILFKQVKDCENKNDVIQSFKARLDLDEAINSLVYQPLADPHSWWCNLQKEARKTLDKAVIRINKLDGYKAKCQWLGGFRDDILKQTQETEDIALPYTLPLRNTPGKVLACLRVYAQINEEKMPGRVIFYPR